MNARAMAERVVDLIARRWWVALLLLATGLGISGAAYYDAVDGDLTAQPVDNRVEIWFLEDDPALTRYKTFQEDFGNDEVILVVVQDDATVFTPRTLSFVAEVSSRVKAIRKVDGVTSLATVIHIGPDLGAESMYEGPVASQDEADEIRERVLSDPRYRTDLLSRDTTTTLISIRMGLLEDVDSERAAILAEVEQILRSASENNDREPRDWAWAGMGVGNEALNEITREDTPLFTNLSVLVIVICLFLALRRVLPVLAAMLAVVTAVALMWGVYLALGNKLNMVTMILPSLVMVIGLTDSIYFLTTYYQERDELEGSGLTKREAIVKSLGFCFLPGLFNSLTASVAFLAFASARMAVIRQLGLFASVGIMMAFITSVVFCVTVCVVFDVRPPVRKDDRPGWMDRFLAWISELVVRHPRKILACSVAILALAVLGITRLQVDSDPVSYFYDDHPVRKDVAFIDDNFGPALPLEFVVDSGEDQGIKELPLLEGMDDMEHRVIEREDSVRGSMSLVGVSKRVNWAIIDEYDLPPNREALHSGLELFYDPDRVDDPLRLVTFPDYRKGRVTFRVPSVSSREIERLCDGVERDGEETLPEGATIEAAGYPNLYVHLIDYLVEAQIKSVLITFLMVFLIIGILFRSPRYALISIPPNIIPITLTLGFMGFAGINLDGATVLVAAISLGVAVDDTVHFIFKFKSVYEQTGDDVVAVQRTIRTTGVAILTTSLVVALGFSVVCFASLKSVAYFGLLTAVTMLAALVGELLVTPAIILTFRPRRPPES